MKTLKVLFLTTAGLCAGVFVFLLGTMPPTAVRLAPAPERASRTVVAGVVHVHTRRSDGTGTVEEVAAAAARAGLRFVVFTDHGDGTRPSAPPAYHSGVLCIDAVEIGTNGGHYIAVGMQPAPYPLAGEARDVVEDVRRLGGFGIAAHPDSPKAALRWREWTAPFDAFEWLNADSEWRHQTAPRLVHAFFEYMFRGPESVASLFNRPEATLARFDTLSRQRRVVALAGADAHARIGIGRTGDPYEDDTSLHVPSYESVFRAFALRAQLDRPLTGRAGLDGLAVRGALAAGHVYTSLDAVAAPPDFDFSARSGAFSARAGDNLAVGGAVDIDARVNAPAGLITLLENGRRVAEGRGTIAYRAAARPAVFRVEVGLAAAPGRPPIPWIVSNPIYVGGLVDPRQPVVRPDAVGFLDVTDRAGKWTIEREPQSAASLAREGESVLDLDYALAPRPATNPYVALVHTATRLDACDRLQFRGSADRPMRLSLQLRASTRPGGERWQRSVYLDTQPRDITVFLDELRPVESTSRWRPDLTKADSVLFVIDTTNTRPGTSGRVRLEGVKWGITP